MNEPRPATISALPFESKSSVANSWNTRTGSAALSTVTALVRRILRVRAAAAARIIVGAESRNSRRWCSPMPNTSRPTSSASVIASSNSLRCRAGSTARPAASTVAATKLSTPICISGLLCCFLPQRLEGAAPRDELIQHLVNRRHFSWIRLEDTEIFEVGIHRKQNLEAHRGHLYLRQNKTQVLDRARSTGAAVANETSRFVVPLGEQKIDRVLERTGDTMVVLGRDENVGIETLDLGGPRFGVGLTVLPHYRWHRFVEKRQVKIFDVHELELGVAALLCDFVNPFSHGLAIATRPRASNDDGTLQHKFLSGGF